MPTQHGSYYLSLDSKLFLYTFKPKVLIFILPYLIIIDLINLFIVFFNKLGNKVTDSNVKWFAIVKNKRLYENHNFY